MIWNGEEGDEGLGSGGFGREVDLGGKLCHAGDHPPAYVQDDGAITESKVSGGVQGRGWVSGGCWQML
jgi:hypothetical protein